MSRLFILSLAVAASACSSVPPPEPANLSAYCASSANSAHARALRADSVAWVVGGASALAFAAAPFAATRPADRNDGALAAAGLTVAALGLGVAALRESRVAGHERAIAFGFGRCVGAAGTAADLAVATRVYELWIDPDMSRGELMRRLFDGQPRGAPPPMPPPWADEPIGPMPEDERSPILEVNLPREAPKNFALAPGWLRSAR